MKKMNESGSLTWVSPYTFVYEALIACHCLISLSRRFENYSYCFIFSLCVDANLRATSLQSICKCYNKGFREQTSGKINSKVIGSTLIN